MLGPQQQIVEAASPEAQRIGDELDNTGLDNLEAELDALEEELGMTSNP